MRTGQTFHASQCRPEALDSEFHCERRHERWRFGWGITGTSARLGCYSELCVHWQCLLFATCCQTCQIHVQPKLGLLARGGRMLTLTHGRRWPVVLCSGTVSIMQQPTYITSCPLNAVCCGMMWYCHACCCLCGMSASGFCSSLCLTPMHNVLSPHKLVCDAEMYALLRDETWSMSRTLAAAKQP